MNQKQSLLLFATAFGVAVAMSQPAIARLCKHTITVQDCAFGNPFKAYVGTKAKWSSRVEVSMGFFTGTGKMPLIKTILSSITHT